MYYKPRPGIVKTKLCGMNVLIPQREASAYCTTIQQLPMLWAATWDAFCKGASIESSIPVHVAFTKKSPEECRVKLEQFCRTMVERGFMVEVPEEEPDAETKSYA